MTNDLTHDLTSSTTRATSSTTGRYAPGTLLTLNEIADLLGHHPATVKTWRSQGRWPNAVKDKSGRRTWRVPVQDLVASGDLDPAEVVEVETALAARRESRETTALREQIIRLQEQLTAACALAQERAATVTLLMGLVRKGGAA